MLRYVCKNGRLFVCVAGGFVAVDTLNSTAERLVEFGPANLPADDPPNEPLQRQREVYGGVTSATTTPAPTPHYPDVKMTGRNG